MKPEITVEVLVGATREKVWQYWTLPEHIVHWNFASDDWCAPRAENDVREGGVFTCRMEAKDGSAGFDFSGTYTSVQEYERLEYTMMGEDARKVRVEFIAHEGGCKIVETFEAEGENSLELQQAGWQSILNNFKKYVEAA